MIYFSSKACDMFILQSQSFLFSSLSIYLFIHFGHTFLNMHPIFVKQVKACCSFPFKTRSCQSITWLVIWIEGKRERGTLPLNITKPSGDLSGKLICIYFLWLYSSDPIKNGITANKDTTVVVLDTNGVTNDSVFDSPACKRMRLLPPVNERLMIYIRQEPEEAFTPLHLVPPSTLGLLSAVSFLQTGIFLKRQIRKTHRACFSLKYVFFANLLCAAWR